MLRSACTLQELLRARHEFHIIMGQAPGGKQRPLGGDLNVFPSNYGFAVQSE
jgi:hypothetical protein